MECIITHLFIHIYSFIQMQVLLVPAFDVKFHSQGGDLIFSKYFRFDEGKPRVMSNTKS